jgi:hypothetical protein
LDSLHVQRILEAELDSLYMQKNLKSDYIYIVIVDVLLNNRIMQFLFFFVQIELKAKFLWLHLHYSTAISGKKET